MSVRAELLAIVEKQDPGAVVQFLKSAKSRGHDLTDTLAECSQRNREDVWERLYAICSEMLLDDNVDEDEEKTKEKKAEQYAFLDGLVTLALATVEQKNINIPAALVDTATVLHGLLPVLPDEVDALKYRLACLLETWWRQELEGRENIVTNTLLYLLRRSLARGTVSDVKCVWRLHTVLPLINFDLPSASDLKNMLGRCCSSTHYIKTDEGRRFLGYVMSLNAGVTDLMHGAIKNQIPYAPKSWLPLYGDMYFRAWQKSTGDMLEKLENDCIQDLMNHCIHSTRQGPQPMFNILFRVLHYFHSQKKQRGVDSMLLKLYNPFLWRSLSVPNTEIRANSAALLLDAFPLQDTDSNAEDSDVLIQKQFDFIQRLVTDPCPEIRALTAEGMCRILRDFLEMIPGDVVHSLLCKLLKELAWDTASPAVRVAVVKGMTAMLDNPMCHLLLKPLLPGLSMCLHDKAETVRVAMVDLLLRVKGVQAIKYWSISPIEHLLARLETDSQPVVRRVVQLLFPSFFPLDQTPQEQVTRCMTLVESNAAAARVFFLNAPRHLTLNDTVRYISLLCRYVLESVRTMSERLDRSEAEPSDRAKSARSKRSKGKQTQGAAKQSEEESEGDSDDDALSPEMLQGLLEAVFLMWTAVSKQLDSAENDELKQSIMKKLSVTVPEVLKVTEDPKVISLVVEIAGHLPPKAVPTISRGCLSKLRNMPEGSGEEDYIELLEAMCLWEMAPQVLQLLSDWLEESLTPQESLPEPAKKKDKKGKKRVQISVPEDKKLPLLAVDYLTAMLRSAVCKRVLIEDQRPLLLILNKLFAHVVGLIEKRLDQAEALDDDNKMASFEQNIFSLHLRLSILLQDFDGDEWDCVTHMKDILAWGQEKLLPLLAATDPDLAEVKAATKGKKKGGAELKGDNKADLANACVMTTLTVCSNMLMVGLGDTDFMTQLTAFCQAALSNVKSVSMVDQVLSCLYQLLLFEELDSSSVVVKCMSHVLVSVNTCLHHHHHNDPKVVSSVKTKISSIVTSVMSGHQSGDDQDVAMVTELTSTLLAAVLAELTHASKQDTLAASVEDKQDVMPAISTCVLTCLTRSTPGRRRLVEEIENCVQSGAVTDVHTAHGVVHLLLVIRSKGNYSTDVDLSSLQNTVSGMVTKLSEQPPDGDNSDPEFREVMETIQTKLQTVMGKTS
ncbi:condensin-2 complex subunit G2-like [Littorina saxatilis]|uniref:condensin-2 complex subunit G2-like n=1 Tax=Littorina saxatilis TaxID=31220 RepID=UPI0038B50A13